MRTSSTQRQSGLTLVELLVALAVGLFLTAGIIQLMANSNQAARSVEASSFVQENARFALATLAHDIRMAGFLGCRSLSDEGLIVRSSSSEFDNDARAGGFTQLRALIGAEADPPGLGSVVRKPETSVLRVFSAQGEGAVLASDSAPAGTELNLRGNPDGLKTGDVAVITDCESADIFTVSAVTGSDVQHTVVEKPYAAGARVFPIRANAYVVGTRQNTSCANQSCLYQIPLGRRNTSGGRLPAQDLVALDDMRLRFGEAAGGGVIYKEAGDNPDWGQVQSVRIGLLVASDPDRNVTSSAQTYLFADPAEEDPEPTTADDRRLRVPYWMTVALRNNLP